MLFFALIRYLCTNWFAVLPLYLILFFSQCKSRPVEISEFKENDPEDTLQAIEFPGNSKWYNTSRFLALPDLRGKIVILNFWSYSCINCIHVLQDLKKLEQKWNKELIVVSVFCAKNDAEKDTENIRQAILRNGITHPVYNDKDRLLWQKYGLDFWPTLVIVNPNGEILGKTSGEDVFNSFNQLIEEIIKGSYEKGEINQSLALPIQPEIFKEPEAILSFPERLAINETEEILFISDTNHNRILKVDIPTEKIIDAIGNGNPGNSDGNYDTAEFNHPQGIHLKNNVLFVADTGNHLIRKIHLTKKKIETLAGTGNRARTINLPGIGKNTELSSPVDLIEYNNQLYITMAGHHQIWRMNLDSQEIDGFAGSGQNNLFDGKLPVSSLSQPSGITRHFNKLYFSDSETSAIRSADIDEKGEVKTIAGKGLFEFGDVDGFYPRTRLQNPSGIIVHKGLLHIADTFNNKIKTLNPVTKQIKTLVGTGKAGAVDGDVKVASLFEPAGLVAFRNKIYIADRNNHLIRVFDLNSGHLSTLKIKMNPAAFKNKNSFWSGFKNHKLPDIKISPKSNYISLKINPPKDRVWKYDSPFYFKKTSQNEKAFQFISESEEYFKNPKFPISFPVKPETGSSDITITSIVNFCDPAKINLELYKKFLLKFKVIVDSNGIINPTIDADP